jgi:predicted site-specific integrase-resolvase
MDMANERADLLGTVATADMIGIERSTLVRWVQLGRIVPAMRLPGRTGAYLFYRSEVETAAGEWKTESEKAAS